MENEEKWNGREWQDARYYFRFFTKFEKQQFIGSVNLTKDFFKSIHKNFYDFCNLSDKGMFREIRRKDRYLNGKAVSKNAAFCEICGRVFDIDDMCLNDDSELFCLDCFSDNYCTCRRCGGGVDLEDAIFSEIEEDYYCEDCYNERFTHCEHCGAELYYDDCISCNDYPYCEQCCSICEECDEPYLGAYCENCSCEYIHKYGYKPKPVFLGKKNNNSNEKFFGTEVEVDKGSDKIELAEDLHRYFSDFCYLKEDGSLSDGLEIVSHPMTFNEYCSKRTDILKMFDICKEYGFYSYDTETCGNHFHVSRNYFSTLDIFKLLTFFRKYQEFILIISQRGTFENLNEWSKIETGKGEIKKSSKHKKVERRYTAINLNNPGTIEFRIFKGTLNICSFFKNLQFVNSICSFVKNISLTEITIEKYISYVSENKKENIDLINFLEKKNVITKIGKNICVLSY